MKSSILTLSLPYRPIRCDRSVWTCEKC